MRIYLSTTLTDLAEHRSAIVDALNRLPLESYESLEISGANDSLPDAAEVVDELLALVKDASLYVLVLGWRYGYVPEGQSKSIVELEYDCAKQEGAAILCFLVEEGASVRGNLIETGENASALRRFKSRVIRENAVRRFDSPDQLAADVASLAIMWLHSPMSRAAQDMLDRPVLQLELEAVRLERRRALETVDELKRRVAGVVPAIPVWRSRNFAIDTTLCFCLMPFQEIFFRVYEEGVVPAAHAAGLRTVHAGQIFDNREIMEDIWESICSARIIVADVSDRNPNVFYELGICHTLGKEVVIITQDASDVPFDIRHRRFIKYSADSMATLRAQLQQTVQRVLLRSEDGA
jgi:hypothetical protein